MHLPDVHYARSGEVAIAYQVVGSGSGLAFEPRGTHELKGVPGEWELFRVVG